MKNRKVGRRAVAWVGVGGILLGLAIAAFAALPPLSFAPFTSVSLGPPGCQDVDCSEGPIDATAGDFNHDGKLDIATANNGSDDVTILLGDGLGGLTSSVTLTASSGPAGIASGDLNGDSKLDLVVSKELTNNIGVFLGKGDGTFDPEVEYDMGNSPQGVVLADFNGDGKLDVATADLFGNTVSVRLGKGDGTFGDLMQTQVPGGPYEMAAGKLDAGDVLDLAVTLYDDSALATLIGQGDGTFLYAGTTATAMTDDSPRGVALADFNHDGKLDAAVTTESCDAVDVLLGNGDGTFQPLTFTPGAPCATGAGVYGVGGFPESVVTGDFNGDGILDLASADSFGTIDFDGTVSVLLGNGDGTFADSQQFQVDPGPYGLVAADLNGDHLPDIVTANLDSDNVSVLKNTGTAPVTCVGDCDGSGMVSINELIKGVNIALDEADPSTCPAFENAQGKVNIAQLIKGVNNALNGCTAG